MKTLNQILLENEGVIFLDGSDRLVHQDEQENETVLAENGIKLLDEYFDGRVLDDWNTLPGWKYIELEFKNYDEALREAVSEVKA